MFEGPGLMIDNEGSVKKGSTFYTNQRGQYDTVTNNNNSNSSAIKAYDEEMALLEKYSTIDIDGKKHYKIPIGDFDKYKFNSRADSGVYDNDKIMKDSSFRYYTPGDRPINAQRNVGLIKTDFIQDNDRYGTYNKYKDHNKVFVPYSSNGSYQPKGGMLYTKNGSKGTFDSGQSVSGSFSQYPILTKEDITKYNNDYYNYSNKISYDSPDYRR